MKVATDPLWQRLDEYSPDKPGDAQPFSAKLAREQGWTAAFTARAIEEYKRFVYLCCTAPAGASPSKIVDEVWHLHLTYTVEYWNHFCAAVLQRDLHHHPSGGGDTESEKYRALYADTLVRYGQTFEAPPPADLWPPALPPVPDEPRFEEPGFWVPRYSWNALAVLALPFAAIAVFYGQPVPFLLSGPHFLFFFPLLACCCFGVVLRAYTRLRDTLRLHLDSVGAPDAVELAFLTGGTKRVALLLTADALEQGGLTYERGGVYDVNHTRLAEIQSPLATHLESRARTDFTYLESGAETVAAPLREKHGTALAAFQWHGALHWPIVLLLAIGAARLVQGMMGGWPVGYLIFMLVAAAVGAAVLLWSQDMPRQAMRIFRAAPETYTGGASSDTVRLIILSGFAGLAAIPAYAHLRPHFANEIGSSGGGDGGGGGGDGGGSCGGGCGGCGGCGG